MSQDFQPILFGLDRDTPPAVNRVIRFLIRVSAFLLKEILEIMRQPLLLVTLVFGPFLILLFFGLGYRNEAQPMRTLFVVEPNSPLAGKIEEYASSLGPQLVFAGVTDDMEEAREKLRRGEIDLITRAPANVYETILNNEQAVFQLLHHEINPFQLEYINVFGRVYTEEVNRRILRFLTAEGQTSLAEVQQKLGNARTDVGELNKLLKKCAEILDKPEDEREEKCDTEAIREYIQDMDRQIDEVEMMVGGSLLLFDALQQELGTEDEDLAQVMDSLTRIIQQTNELSEVADSAEDYLQKLETLTALETDLSGMQSGLDEFLRVDPRVLISPFRTETASVATITINMTDYFAPSVIVLLLQHLMLTFAALSLVREQQLGTTELFYVSPLSALETLLGKYLSYLIFGGALSAVLLALMVYGINVPAQGSWLDVWLVIFAVIFASLGMGFIISLISKTDTQAVQYAMIVLLTSVFFSGFLLGLETLWEPVRAISWTIPATYGSLLLRDIMLRGGSLSYYWFILLAIGLGLFGGAWWLLRRSMTDT